MDMHIENHWIKMISLFNKIKFFVSMFQDGSIEQSNTSCTHQVSKVSPDPSISLFTDIREYDRITRMAGNADLAMLEAKKHRFRIIFA